MMAVSASSPFDLPIAVSSDDRIAADALKSEANAFFAHGKYADAIEKYTEAISRDPTAAPLYSNRAFAYIKTELFGYAIQDADTALRVDPSYIKAYYRRATALMGLNKLKDALNDYRLVLKTAPSDKDARSKAVACEKELKRRAFEEAMAYDELHMTAAEKVGDPMQIVVEESYDGPQIDSDGITRSFVEAMLPFLRAQKRLHRRCAVQILLATKAIFEAQQSLVDINIPKDAKLTVCGDVHGQYYDLLNIFELNGLPSETNMYLFNGDFVDRGSFSVEVMLTLLAYKWLYPNSLFLSRGNHETNDMNKVYGFEGEVKAKYTDLIFKLFSEVFNAIPLANLIQKRVLVVHGGLFSRDEVSLDEIRAIDRFRQPGSEGLMCELLWADPQPQMGRSPSKRGVGLQFGPDITDEFCKFNNLDCIIRSHEVQQNGYSVEHNGKCITIFSAPNYCDNVGNMGAYIHITPDEKEDKGYKMDFVQFRAVPHPPVKAMQYASQLYGNAGL